MAIIDIEEARLLREKVENYPSKNQAAKLLFFSGESFEQIEKVMGIPTALLKYNAQRVNGWAVEKKRDGATAVNYFVQCKSRALEQTAGKALHILATGLDDWATIQEAGGVLNEKQLTAAANILNSLDKIQRLEDGAATEIVHRAGLSVAEARKQLAADPMAYGIIDVTPRVKKKPIDVGTIITKEMVIERAKVVDKERAGLDDERPNVFGEEFEKGK